MLFRCVRGRRSHPNQMERRIARMILHGWVTCLWGSVLCVHGFFRVSIWEFGVGIIFLAVGGFAIRHHRRLQRMIAEIRRNRGTFVHHARNGDD